MHQDIEINIEISKHITKYTLLKHTLSWSHEIGTLFKEMQLKNGPSKNDNLRYFNFHWVGSSTNFLIVFLGNFMKIESSV